jgi:hypothetical protein
MRWSTTTTESKQRNVVSFWGNQKKPFRSEASYRAASLPSFLITTLSKKKRARLSLRLSGGPWRIARPCQARRLDPDRPRRVVDSELIIGHEEDPRGGFIEGFIDRLSQIIPKMAPSER